MAKLLKPSMKVLWGWIPIALALSSIHSCAFAQAPVEISFELEHPKICAMEPVRVRFLIRNNSEEFVGIQPSLSADTQIDVWVKEPGGKTIHPTTEIRGGFVHVEAVVVSPGETTARSALVSQLFQFKNPGIYKLKLSLAGQVQLQSGRVYPKSKQIIELEPETISLQVDPRNAKHLDTVCRLLAKTATGHGENQPRIEAGTDLSYIGDPIALPYLEQVVAAHNAASPVAVRGLVRLASPQALQALRSELGNANGALKDQIEKGMVEITTGEGERIMD